MTFKCCQLVTTSYHLCPTPGQWRKLFILYGLIVVVNMWLSDVSGAITSSSQDSRAKIDINMKILRQVVIYVPPRVLSLWYTRRFIACAEVLEDLTFCRNILDLVQSTS